MGIRRKFIACGVTLLLIWSAAPASAQYGGGGGPGPTTTSTIAPTTTTTTAPTTTTTTGPTTTTTDPDQPSEPEEDGAIQDPAAISDDVVSPGQTVTISGPAPGTYQPGTTVDVAMVRGREGAPARILVTNVAVAADGSVSAQITIPADTPAGVYYIYIEGVAPNGKTRFLIVAIVVTSPANASGQSFTVSSPRFQTSAQSSDRSASHSASPPMRGLQAQISSDKQEQEVVDSVVLDGAKLAVRNGQLLVDGESVGGGGDAPLAALLVLGVVLGGFFVLKRRSNLAGEAQ